MMTITEYFRQKAPNTLNLQTEVSDPSGKYKMFDDGGVECETGEFLYGLVRIMKPQSILETGTYSGISTMYMAQGLIDNGEIFPDGYGKMKTVEFEQYHLQRAKELWDLQGVSLVVGVHHGESLKYEPDRNYDIIFLDTEPAIRFAEFEKFYPFLNPGGMIMIHDLAPSMCQGNVNPDHPEIASYPFGDIPPRMKEIMQTEVVKFHLPAPRGFTLFYKPKEGDYRA